ncbi:MAG: PKD domain-containing protein, partial [Saprospiraceae bacterium]
MKKIYPIILFLIFATFLFSQKETNNWVFGNDNWLDFNTDPVTAQDNFDLNINATRGTVSVSDKEGNLLFYSNARRVFDRNNQVMPNGDFNTLVTNTHPVAVFLKPNSEHSYYLIYKKFNNIPGSPSTLKWLEVDMTLNNGLGDVKTSTNNEILGGDLLDNPTGKITVARHDNLIDFWIISHEENSDAYYAWLVTASGINSTPVISNIGIPIITLIIPDSANGQIKVSPNGKKIAVVNRGENNAEIFDFDQATGTLSNTITLNQFINPRGLEFSPSGQYLYISHEGFQTDSRVLQYDLWAGNQTAINNSKLSIGNPTNNGTAGGLQLASNGKIYSINIGDTSLGIIHQPDNDGFTCDFEQEGQSGISGNPFFGFPSFLHSYFDKPYFSYDGICSGNTTTFLIDGFDATINSVIWDFGDPASGVNNTSTNINPSHNYPSPGNYYVTLTITSNNQTFTKKQLIHIAPTTIDIGNDTTLCSNQIMEVDVFTPNATYQWSNGFSTSAIGITSPGTYSVTVSVANCPTLIDEITVNHIPAPNADLGGDGALCDGDPVTLDATNSGASYLWSTGSTTSSITLFFADTYAVTVTNPNGCSDIDEV